MNDSDWYCVGIGVAAAAIYIGLAVVAWYSHRPRQRPTEYSTPCAPPVVVGKIELNAQQMRLIHAAITHAIDSDPRSREVGLLCGFAAVCWIKREKPKASIDLYNSEVDALRRFASRHQLDWLVDTLAAACTGGNACAPESHPAEAGATNGGV